MSANGFNVIEENILKADDGLVTSRVLIQNIFRVFCPSHFIEGSSCGLWSRDYHRVLCKTKIAVSWSRSSLCAVHLARLALSACHLIWISLNGNRRFVAPTESADNEISTDTHAKQTFRLSFICFGERRKILLTSTHWRGSCVTHEFSISLDCCFWWSKYENEKKSSKAQRNLLSEPLHNCIINELYFSPQPTLRQITLQIPPRKDLQSFSVSFRIES